MTVALSRRNAERDAAAGAAAVEPEHQAGLFRGAAMVERINAERTVLADQPRRNLFDEVEARPPHQRAIAEHPEVACREFRILQGSCGHQAKRFRAKWTPVRAKKTRQTKKA